MADAIQLHNSTPMRPGAARPDPVAVGGVSCMYYSTVNTNTRADIFEEPCKLIFGDTWSSRVRVVQRTAIGMGNIRVERGKCQNTTTITRYGALSAAFQEAIT